jgi:formate hydrogenlyase transcriptional activator
LKMKQSDNNTMVEAGVSKGEMLDNRMHKQQPNDILKKITKKIAGTSEKVALLKAIYELVMPLFEVPSTGLFIINEKENYHYDLTVIYPELDNSELNRKHAEEISNYKIEHAATLVDFHFQQLKKKPDPSIFDFEKGFKKYSHPFSQEILAEEYKETYAALLQTGSEPFGIFYINSKERGSLQKIDATMYQQVADLIAIALSNILAKEEILKREKEKTQLLTISEAIATVQNSKQLLRVIYEKIYSTRLPTPKY